MWKNIGVTSVNTTGTSTTVTLGGQTQSAADKLAYQEPENFIIDNTYLNPFKCPAFTWKDPVYGQSYTFNFYKKI